MKLEEKFFCAFFYPFLVAIVLSTLIITIFLGLFTSDNFFERTCNNIINLEKKKCKNKYQFCSTYFNNFYSKSPS